VSALSLLSFAESTFAYLLAIAFSPLPDLLAFSRAFSASSSSFAACAYSSRASVISLCFASSF
jgi:hypothetical protein